MIYDNCTVITMDSQRRILTGAAFAVDGDTFATVGKSADVRAAHPDDEVQDLQGWLVLPGLIDGHIHLPQAMLRGSGDEVPLWVWMAQRIFILEGNYTPADVQASTRLAIVEMIKAGTTTFLETLILGRHDMAALADVIGETGVRAVLPRAITDGGGYLDESPLHPGLDEAPDDAIEDALTVARQLAGSEHIQIWLGPRSTGGCSEGLLQEIIQLARREGMGICQHYAMTDREKAYIRSRYGKGQVEFLESFGMLGDDVVLVHCCAMDADDIDRLRGTGTSIVHCPTGPAKMGSGVTPVRGLLDAGVNVALGTDAAAANNGADLLRDLKWVAYLQKLIEREPTVVTAENVLEMATIGGARALGLGTLIGSIEPGKRADFIVIHTDGPHWVPTINPVANLVYASTGADVDTVVVAGKTLMQGRELCTLDEERVLSEARAAVDDLYARTGVERPVPWPVV
jgi:cytosine/adenosine deaminase-related metal-dependent hydrolase